MDNQKIRQIRDALLVRAGQIGDRAPDRDYDALELNTAPAELIDMAQGLEQMGREASLAEQDRRELLAIERALSKMTSGSFGVCEECSEEIPSRRLMVLPEARLCAHCQTYEERQNSRTRLLRNVAR